MTTTDRKLEPGDRVLVEAVAAETQGWLFITAAADGSTIGIAHAPDVVWHHDDQTELATEVERLKREVDLMRTANDAYWRAQKVLDEALGTEEDDGTGEGLAEEVRLLAEQRDEARAQVAAMRPVVEAAEAWRVAHSLDKLDASEDLWAALDAYRADQS